MPPDVRLVHPGRRRLIVDSLTAPRVRLRQTRDDNLDAARGVLTGVLIGIVMWIAILAWFTWG